MATEPLNIQINTADQPEKDFLGWYKKKIEVNQRVISFDFAQQDIWWCSLGINIGFEEDGKNEDFERPVLILKKFSKDVFIGLPLTSTKKESPYYFPIKLHDQEGSILLSHPRLLSSKRLNRKLIKISRGIFKEVLEEHVNLFTESRNPTQPEG